MNYVKIKVKKMGTSSDLQLWENHMQEKPKCWNKFCLGIHGEDELHAVHVTKEGDEDNTYLTVLCKDCIEETSDNGILVNENHLILDSSLNNFESDF